MNKHRVFEIICVVFLLAFIFFISGEDSYSDKTVSEVFEAVSATMDVSELSKIKKNKVKQEFGIDFSQVDSYVYYASDSIMTVDELMIIKLKEDVKAEDITDKIEKRIKEKQVLFEGYAPEQSALLNGYVLTYDKGFIFYAVSENATDALITFSDQL